MRSLHKFIAERPVLTLLVVAFLLLMPLLILGFPWSGHDAGYHITWTRAFSEQFWSGDLYPRWLHGTDRGLGGPVFYLYPPMEGYLASLFQPLASVDPSGRFRLSLTMLLVTLLTTLFAYRWLDDMTESRPAAFFGTLVYVMAPYHLAIDLYLRTAVAEYIAFMWIPLILHGVRQVVNNKEDNRLLNRRILMGTAGLLLTHLLTALMLLPVVLGYLLLLALPGKRTSTFLRAGTAGLLGAGIAAIYLLPITTYGEETLLPVMWDEWILYYENFLPDMRILHTLPGEANLLTMVIMTMLFFWLLAVAWGFVRERRKCRGEERPSPEVRYWFWILLPALFLCTHLSYPLWAVIEPLQRLQFPWRFMVIFTIALAPLSVWIYSRSSESKNVVRSILIGRASIVMVLLFTAMVLLVRYGYDEQRYLRSDRVERRIVNPFEYLPNCVDLSMGYDSVKSFVRRSDSDLVHQIYPATASVEGVEEAGLISLRAEPASADTVRVDLWRHYSPLWQGRARSGERVQLQCVPPHGLLRVVIPPGTTEVKIELMRSEVEALGGWVSLGSLILGLLLLYLPRREKIN